MHDRTAPSLRSLQESFWDLIRAPTGVVDVLRDHAQHRQLVETVREDERASASERLDIYANMYFYRLHDNLALDFPKLHAVLGAADFNNLVTDYLYEYPSRSPSVRYLGERLPLFLRDHSLADVKPWLSDLAQLEWARLDVSDRADELVLNLADLQGFAAQGFSELRLVPIRAHVLIEVDYSIEAVWRSVQRAEWDGTPPAAGKHGVLVWRQQHVHVAHRSLESRESALFARLQLGLDFEAFCDLVAEHLPPEEAAQYAITLLSTWTQAGLLSKVEVATCR